MQHPICGQLFGPLKVQHTTVCITYSITYVYKFLAFWNVKAPLLYLIRTKIRHYFSHENLNINFSTIFFRKSRSWSASLRGTGRRLWWSSTTAAPSPPSAITNRAKTPASPHRQFGGPSPLCLHSRANFSAKFLIIHFFSNSTTRFDLRKSLIRSG